MTLVVVDYGMGNLHSVAKALERAGGRPRVTGDPDLVAGADRLVLPGVGAFPHAIAELRRTGLDEAIRRHLAAQRPFLGICLGLQLLATRSHEDGLHDGLDVIPGECVRFEGAPDRPGRFPPAPSPTEDWSARAGTPFGPAKYAAGCEPADRPLRIPHIGWNQVQPTREVDVLAGIPSGTSFYFVHSYHLRPVSPADVAAETDYGGRFCSMVQRGHIVATQFHPEKSQRWGLKLLENWLAL